MYKSSVIMSDKHNMLSFSMCVDENMAHSKIMTSKKGSVADIKSMQKRKIYAWVRDEMVNICYHCKAEFGYMTRKHHCRACGRIFCYYCCSKWTKLPRTSMEIYPVEPSSSLFGKVYNKFYNPNSQDRVCDNCFKKIEQLKDIEDTFLLFFQWLTIEDVKKVKGVSRLWNRTSLYYLSKMREIQYKLPFKEYLPMETQIVKQNYKNFAGHSQWLYPLIMCSEMNDERDVANIIETMDKPKRTKCWDMMCSSTCKDAINPYKASIILMYKNNIPDNLMKKLILYLDDIDERVLDSYFMMFTNRLIEEEEMEEPLLTRYLFDRVSKSIKMAYYFVIDLHTSSLGSDKDRNVIIQKIKNKFLIHLMNYKKDLFTAISKVFNLQQLFLSKIIDTEYVKHDIHIHMQAAGNIHIPLHLNKTYNGVDVDNINTKNSAFKPVQIPFIRSDGTGTDSILYKEEDLRQDYIICKIIKLIAFIIKKDMDIDSEIISYDIVPLDSKRGLIEIVNESDTINNIAQDGFTIQNFITRYNPEMKVSELRGKFIKSTAAYCVITYLMGIQDRHLDNIMVHKNGQLFHIDFGYILGHDPKLSNTIIRITPGMLDAMGGLKGDGYKRFCQYSTNIYNIVRQYVSYISCMMLQLQKVDPKVYHIDIIEEEIIRRFEPGVTRVEGKYHLENLMERSRSNNWVYNFSDLIHSTAKSINIF